MKERPIIFSAPMVRAILDGRKTQTRRILKGSTEFKGPYNPDYIEAHKNAAGWRNICQHGSVGDCLWVRESWQAWRDYNHLSPSALPQEARDRINYPANGNVWDAKLRPSIHMPRWASRITLEITEVRVERLQDISDADAIAEGARNFPELPVRSPYDERAWSMETPASRDTCLGSARMAFGNLWEKLHGEYAWDTNPYVWVISFKVISAPTSSAPPSDPSTP